MIQFQNQIKKQSKQNREGMDATIALDMLTA
jgi:hypothetical protein